MADETHALVMPFVTVASNGGPHEDNAYACGFEMGYLDASLGYCKTFRVLLTQMMIHAENRAQADLIAMKHGYSTAFQEFEETPEWVHVTFTYAA